MKPLNILGLKVVGITIAALLALYGIWLGANSIFRSLSDQNKTSESPTPTVDVITLDSDEDDLPDLVENLYKSDPNNPDTDGDGTPDGEEISLGRDPTIAGPEDVSVPPTGANVPNKDTYTFKYLSTLPDDAKREEVLNKEKIESFVDEHKAELLVDQPQDSIKTTEASGKDAIQTYLDSISSTHNDELKPVTNTDIEEAHKLNYAQGQPEAIDNIIQALEQNVNVLREVEAPAEVVELHTKLILASQSLLKNTKALKNIKQDFIGALIAAKNIEELGKTFQDIAKEVESLEGKYGIE